MKNLIGLLFGILLSVGVNAQSDRMISVMNNADGDLYGFEIVGVMNVGAHKVLNVRFIGNWIKVRKLKELKRLLNFDFVSRRDACGKSWKVYLERGSWMSARKRMKKIQKVLFSALVEHGGGNCKEGKSVFLTKNKNRYERFNCDLFKRI